MGWVGSMQHIAIIMDRTHAIFIRSFKTNPPVFKDEHPWCLFIFLLTLDKA